MRNSAACRLARLAVLAIPVAFIGCDSWDRDNRSDAVLEEGYGFDMTPTTREIAAGEIVTIATRSQNLVGRDTRVEWNATGGEIKTDENGAVARIKFDEPGTYTVRARLIVDGRAVEQDSVDIRVRPLRR